MVRAISTVQNVFWRSEKNIPACLKVMYLCDAHVEQSQHVEEMLHTGRAERLYVGKAWRSSHFFAWDEASWIAGEILDVNGGATI